MIFGASLVAFHSRAFSAFGYANKRAHYHRLQCWEARRRLKLRSIPARLALCLPCRASVRVQLSHDHSLHKKLMHLTPIRRVGKTCAKAGLDFSDGNHICLSPHARDAFFCVRHVTRVTVAARALRQCGRTATDGPFAG